MQESVPPATLQHTSFDVASGVTHTMKDSLLDYVEQKIHQDIKNHEWSRIVVRGLYTRASPAILADSEKREKLFNWHRPTATKIDSETIALNCFPGSDYVRHYASLVATYLNLTGKDPSIVQCVLPTKIECMEPFLQSNLKDIKIIDIAVVGYITHLNKFLGDQWQGRESEDNMFGWQKWTTHRGQKIAFVGCMPSFWGDISGYLVRALQELNSVKCVLYVGKAGSLQPMDPPNKLMATGDISYIGDKTIGWVNVLQSIPLVDVQKGTHVTVYSPLCESSHWLKEWQPNCRWVDCEVGHMAEVSNARGTEYGYLHIISDNVAVSNGHNLSNEHLDDVISLRKILLHQMETILESFFNHWRPLAGESDLGKVV